MSLDERETAAAMHGIATNVGFPVADRLQAALQALEWYEANVTSGEEPENRLQTELTRLLNSHAAENESNTPDFILAEYLMQCLAAFNYAVRYRATWYGRIDYPGKGSVPFPPTGPPEIL